MMIEVKQAVEQAIRYLRDLPTAGDGTPTQVTLEEVELTEDDHYWLITLSYREQSGQGAFSVLGSPKYKIFKINADNGRVMSMKIREIARP